jgi:hypothetical protein
LQPECRPLQRLAPPSLGQNPARMNKATFTGRCSESQQQSACESSVQGLDLEVWRWVQVLASARCQLVPAGKRKSRGGTTFPSAHDDIEPGPHWQRAHFGPVSPDRPPHCQWQPLSLLPVPLATSRCRGQATGIGASPARRVPAGRCQCRWSPGPAAHASGPGPVTGSAGSRTALRTWRVLKFRLRRARALQPLANAHGAAVTVLCSPTRSRARATRPPAGLTAAPQSPLRVRPSPGQRQGHWYQLAVACKWAGRGPGPPSTGA